MSSYDKSTLDIFVRSALAQLIVKGKSKAMRQVIAALKKNKNKYSQLYFDEKFEIEFKKALEALGWE